MQEKCAWCNDHNATHKARSKDGRLEKLCVACYLVAITESNYREETEE